MAVFPNFLSALLLLLFTLLQSSQADDGSLPPTLIGDLRYKQTTQVGREIAAILLGNPLNDASPADIQGQSAVIGVSPFSNATFGFGFNSTTNATAAAAVKLCKASTDVCCIWYKISADLTAEFTEKDGTCNDAARAAIRLGFHDAGPWSQKLANEGFDFGGADGSLALFQDEIDRAENNGLQDIIKTAQAYQKRYGVGMADLIQFMATHATVTCPFGPRIRTYIGRLDATRPALNGLMPDVHADASVNLPLFIDKTINPHDLVALLGAHSVAKQFNVDVTKSGMPLDTTPGVWDVLFFNQTLSKVQPNGTFRFPSDMSIAQETFSSIEWQAFALGNSDVHKGIGNALSKTLPNAQLHWDSDYAAAYVRLSLLGVNNINNLTECTMTLPPQITMFQGVNITGPFIDA